MPTIDFKTCMHCSKISRKLRKRNISYDDLFQLSVFW